MPENGILNNVGVSKRSATGITLISLGYMVMNEIKDRRNGKG